MSLQNDSSVEMSSIPASRQQSALGYGATSSDHFLSPGAQSHAMSAPGSAVFRSVPGRSGGATRHRDPSNMGGRAGHGKPRGGPAVAAGGGAGPSGAPSGDSSEAWKKHLFNETARVARGIKKKVAMLHQEVKNDNLHKRDLCHKCGSYKYALDLVVLNCVQYQRGVETRDRHRFCTECVQKTLEEQRQQPAMCGTSRDGIARIEQACNGNLHLIVCPNCRSPNALVSAVRFFETFDRDRIDSKLQFSVHLGASQVLSENFFIERVCENQRRPFFGAFSRANLLVVDFCGAFSTEREYNASEIAETIESLDASIERPNNSWAWLDDWAPDLTVNDRGGWRYARDFNAAYPREWRTEVQMLMFVRRRVLMRTRVRFNDEVVRALVGFFAADEPNDESH